MTETFVHEFLRQMEQAPERLALVCVGEDGSELAVNRAEFLAAARNQAWRLKTGGVGAGEVVLLVLPHGMDLFSSFWGALLLGAVPVVYAYPGSQDQQDSYLESLREFVEAVGCDAVLLQDEEFVLRAGLQETGVALLSPAAENFPVETGEIVPPGIPSLDQMAILQFSSGTTGAKKGVIISHRAMLNYLADNALTLQLSPEDVVVSWLPLNHDMGLIGCFVVPLTCGFPTVVMSPRYWLGRPAELLRQVHKQQGSITMMPNFAFNYLTTRLRDNELAGIDLSSWRVVVSGAEPVNMAVLEAFRQRFSAHGLGETVLRVGYGMAECVLGISRTPVGTQPRADSVDARRLSADHRAVPAGEAETGSRHVASCGVPHPMVEVQIVDDSGRSLGEREVGEIQVKSSTLFSGYWRQPELTGAALAGGWFHTGDLGYLFEGELYVCGRKKDVIISFGNNIYPEDVEEIAESFAEVRNGRCVAFGIYDERKGTENVLVLCELRKQLEPDEQKRLITRIRERIWEKLDVLVANIGIVDRGWIVKTTSGKLARSANREKYLAEKKPPPPT